MDIMDTFYSEIAGSGRDFRKAREKRQNQEQFVKGAVAGFIGMALYIAAKDRREETRRIAETIEYQNRANYFQTWVNNDPAGRAYAEWEPGAQRLIQVTDLRDEKWFDQWKQVLPYFRDQVPAAEQERLQNLPSRLEQSGLKIASIVAFVAAALAAIWFIAGFFMPPPLLEVREDNEWGFHSYYMTYEQCLEIAAEPGIDLVTSPSQCAEVNPVRIQGIRGGVTVALLAVGIGLIFLRRS